MVYALVKVHKGIIDEVLFYFSEKEALKTLDEFVKGMNPENDEAAIFAPDGMVANAKTFLDENEEYARDTLEKLLKKSNETYPIYIIGNPCHDLGFMVASPDDPLGYKNPAEAVFELGQMRKDHGNHLKLFRVIPVDKLVVLKSEVHQIKCDNEVDDFDYTLVEEYVKSD